MKQFKPYLLIIFFLLSFYVAVLKTNAVETACGVKTTKKVNCRPNYQIWCCADWGCRHFDKFSSCDVECPRADKYRPNPESCAKLDDICDTDTACTPCSKICGDCINGQKSCDDQCNQTTELCDNPTSIPIPTSASTSVPTTAPIIPTIPQRVAPTSHRPPSTEEPRNTSDVNNQLERRIVIPFQFRLPQFPVVSTQRVGEITAPFFNFFGLIFQKVSELDRMIEQKINRTLGV